MEILEKETLVGMGLNGTAYGNPSLIDGALGTGIQFTDSNQYATFDGIEQGCPVHPGLCLHGYTIAVWMKVALETPDSPVKYFHLGYKNNGEGIVWIRRTNGMLNFKSLARGTTQQSKVKISSYPKMVWFHIAITYDTTLAPLLYLDGMLASNASYSWVDVTGNPSTLYTPFQIGLDGSVNTTISMDELYIWQRYMEASEIKAIFQGI